MAREEEEDLDPAVGGQGASSFRTSRASAARSRDSASSSRDRQQADQVFEAHVASSDPLAGPDVEPGEQEEDEREGHGGRCPSSRPPRVRSWPRRPRGADWLAPAQGRAVGPDLSEKKAGALERSWRPVGVSACWPQPPIATSAAASDISMRSLTSASQDRRERLRDGGKRRHGGVKTPSSSCRTRRPFRHGAQTPRDVQPPDLVKGPPGRPRPGEPWICDAITPQMRPPKA